jgi:hypothetical protein
MSEIQPNHDLADDSEESEDEINDYVKDDFIDDDSYSERSDHKTKPNGKKRKHKTDVKEEELDEDDLDLINENKGKKGRKRLQKEKYKAQPEEERFDDEVSDHENHQQFIDGDKDEGGVVNEQLDQFNQIFADDSESDDEEIKQKEEPIHDRNLDLEMGLQTDEELRNEIAKVDIPERLYTRLRDRLDPTEDELEDEAKWIFAAKKHWKGYHSGEEKTIESIKGVLRHVRKNHFDIPFIATYRCYLFQQELQTSDFYEIYEMDLEWNNFSKTKKAITEKLDAIRTHISDAEVIDECLSTANNNNDLHDVHQYITFCRSIIPEFAVQKSRLRDVRKKQYALIIDAKIDKFAKEIALRPSDFAKNLRANAMVVKMKRMPTSPSIMGDQYLSEKMITVLEVLVSACSFIADELATHPVVRKCVFDRYMQGVKISTRPTEKGEKELDVFHPSYRCKRLTFVPLDKFHDDLWVDILQCKEKSLIEIIFEHDDVLKDIIDWMKSMYYEPYPGDRFEKEWKTFYDEIIERVIGVVLKPEFEKRASQDLKERS